MALLEMWLARSKTHFSAPWRTPVGKLAWCGLSLLQVTSVLFKTYKVNNIVKIFVALFGNIHLNPLKVKDK